MGKAGRDWIKENYYTLQVTKKKKRKGRPTLIEWGLSGTTS